MTTQPIFILSSGRSGTYSFYNALKKEKNIEIHHEFQFEKTLRNSVSYYLGAINKKKAFKYIYFIYTKIVLLMFWILIEKLRFLGLNYWKQSLIKMEPMILNSSQPLNQPLNLITQKWEKIKTLWINFESREISVIVGE